MELFVLGLEKSGICFCERGDKVETVYFKIGV